VVALNLSPARWPHLFGAGTLWYERTPPIRRTLASIGDVTRTFAAGATIGPGGVLRLWPNVELGATLGFTALMRGDRRWAGLFGHPMSGAWGLDFGAGVTFLQRLELRLSGAWLLSDRTCRETNYCSLVAEEFQHHRQVIEPSSYSMRLSVLYRMPFLRGRP
jgi:hypothetical protein